MSLIAAKQRARKKGRVKALPSIGTAHRPDDEKEYEVIWDGRAGHYLDKSIHEAMTMPIPDPDSMPVYCGAMVNCSQCGNKVGNFIKGTEEPLIPLCTEHVAMGWTATWLQPTGNHGHWKLLSPAKQKQKEGAS